MLRSSTKVGLLAGLSLLGYGCQGVYTRTPLAASHDDRVAGEWRAQGETDTFTIRRDGDEYVADMKDEKPTRFRLLRVGETIYVQSGGKPCTDFPGVEECYSLARLELGPDTAQLFHFDTAAMFTASLTEAFGASYELRRSVGNGAPSRALNDFLLTGPESEARAFLRKYGLRFTATSAAKYTRVKKNREEAK